MFLADGSYSQDILDAQCPQRNFKDSVSKGA